MHIQQKQKERETAIQKKKKNKALWGIQEEVDGGYDEWIYVLRW